MVLGWADFEHQPGISMKITQYIATLSLLLPLLTACGEDSGTPKPSTSKPSTPELSTLDSGVAKPSKRTEETKIKLPYDLSLIPVKCYDNHIEVINDKGAGTRSPLGTSLYFYSKPDLSGSNNCSPSGTDFPFFLVDNNLNNVLAYQQTIGTTKYYVDYYSLEPETDNSILWVTPSDMKPESEPTTVIITGSDDAGDYKIEIRPYLSHSGWSKTQGGVTETKDYHYRQMMADYPMLLKQQAAMDLFKLANGQEPEL